jgi:hypothetical protein
LRTDQIFILYSMFLLENSRYCKELLIERYNKVGDLNLYVVNARFHFKMFVFSTQVRVSLISQNGSVTNDRNEKGPPSFPPRLFSYPFADLLFA